MSSGNVFVGSVNSTWIQAGGYNQLYVAPTSGVGIGSSGSYSGGVAPPANGLIVQGNVGIGTTSPATALDVAYANPNYTAAGLLTLRNTNATYSQTMTFSFGGTALLGANGKQLTVQGSSASSLWQFNDGSGNNAVEIAQSINTSIGHGVWIQGLSGQTADPFHIQNSSGAELFNVTSGGSVGIGTTSPNATLDVNSTSIIIEQSNTPADNATCTAGTIWWDANYIYVCTASGTVKRAALSTF